jgi:heat shock protein HslJ
VQGQPWQWQGTRHPDGSTMVPDDPRRYTIELQPGGGLSVHADCNVVLGAYVLDGSTLSIQLGPTTLVACPPGSLGDDFTRDLAAVTTHTRVDERLVFHLGSDGGEMTFTPLPTLLEGPTWHLRAYNNGRDAVQSLLEGTRITASFGPGGQVSGSAGCNRYTGAYTRTGDRLAIGPLATTRMLCDPPAVMEQERAFVSAMQAAAHVAFQGSEVWFRDVSGAIQVIFADSE